MNRLTIRVAAAAAFGMGLLSQTLVAGDLDVRPDQHYLLLATKRTSTMQQELDQAAALGFRVLRGAPAHGDQVAYFLERTGRPDETGPYVLLATRRVGTLQREMAEWAARGYRLHADSLMWVDCEMVLLMERSAAEDGRFEYEVLSPERTSTLQQEVDDAQRRGFELVSMIFSDEHLVILER